MEPVLDNQFWWISDGGGRKRYFLWIWSGKKELWNNCLLLILRIFPLLYTNGL